MKYIIGKKVKTKEFIKRVEELGCRVEDTGFNLYLYSGEDLVAFVGKKKQYVLEIYILEIYNFFLKQNAEALVDLCVEYAKTPIDEREEEEKFYLQKIKSFYEVKIDKDNMFLILDMDDNSFFLSDVQFYDKYMRGNFKTQFTQKEIDKIKEEQHTDLSEFRQIPVEEVDYDN